MNSTELDHRVLSELRLATTPLTADELADLVFADDADGGPDAADQAIRRSIYSLRDAGHRIVARLGRLGGYVYVGSEDPSRVSLKSKRERRAQVAVLVEIGTPIPRIAARLGLPTRIVVADLRAVGLGHGRTA